MTDKKQSQRGAQLAIAGLIALCAALACYLLFSGEEKVIQDISSTSYPELSSLKDAKQDFKGASDFFQALAQKKGGAYAYRALAAAAMQGNLPPNVDTHLIGHVVGGELYKQEGIEGMKYCTDDLRNACSHSIVVGSFLENGIGTLPDVLKVCDKAPGGSGASSMCAHGLGHGVLAFTDYNLEEAIKICKSIDTEIRRPGDYIQCVGGATMEMMSGVHDRDIWLKQAPNYLSDSDPLMPCDMSFMPEESKPMCYTYLTPHLFEVAGASLANPDPKYFPAVFGYCAKIDNADQRRACTGGLGKEFIVLANDRNVQSIEGLSDAALKKTHLWCGMAKTVGDNSSCVMTAVQSLYWGGENKPDVAIRFCSLAPNAKVKDDCFADLTGAVSYFVSDPGYKQDFCKALPAGYSSKCEKAIL